VVVAVNEDGEDTSDRPGTFLSGPGALQKLGQVAEHARRIAARDGRLACRQRDLAGGMGEARHGVDDQQNVLAAIAEIFGDG
jgi:hypothetical protein